MKLVWILFFISFSAIATVRAPEANCPSGFNGRVEEVVEPEGPSHSLMLQKVIFHNLENDKMISVETLKHGPVNFEKGQDYNVQVKNGRLCWVEKI